MKQLGLLLCALVVLGILVLFSSIISQGYGEVATARAEQKELEGEKLRLERQVHQMRSMLGALKSNPQAVESLARKELGWVRPEEKILILKTPTPIPSPENLTGADEPPILTLPD